VCVYTRNHLHNIQFNSSKVDVLYIKYKNILLNIYAQKMLVHFGTVEIMWTVFSRC